MKERNQSIDAVKGIAIVLVMIGHVFVHNHMEDPYIYDAIRAVQMPLFMIISGYLCGQGRKIRNLKDYGRILGKRAVSYLVPFFSWLTLMHLTNLKEAYETILFQLDYGLWFLAVLFLLTFMVSTAQLFASAFQEKHPAVSEAVFWVVYAGLCLIPFLQLLNGNQFLSPNLLVLYIPFYLLGYIAGNYGKHIFVWGKKESGKIDCRDNLLIKTAVLMATLLFLWLVITKNLNSMESRADMIVQMLASVLGSTAIIYGVCLLREGKIKNRFAKLGEYTLEIYVIHYHFANLLNIYDRQYQFYTLEGFLFVAVSFLVMSAATFCTVWLMKKVRILDFLFFGK